MKFARHAVVRSLLAAGCAAVFALAPASAFAVGPTLQQRQAQERTVKQELEQSKIELAEKVAAYVEISQQLQQIQEQIVQVEAEIIAADARLAKATQSVKQRAVQLYRGGRVDMVEVLLSSESVGQFMDRAYYLVLLGSHDSDLITETRIARAESLWLQESLDLRAEKFQRLQEQADEQREAIEKRVEEQEKRAQRIGADISRLLAFERMAATSAGGQPAGSFNPDTIISEGTFRDWASMNVDEIQAFLDQQPGTLKSYKARDHNGKMATTAQMIAEAAQAYRINPKVLLVKLQKEQSLLADRNPKQKQYDWAMGFGAMDSGRIYKYQGFGQQIWGAARVLDKNARPWRPGISLRIDGSRARPTNSATYSLYKYTPHFRGNMSFWMLYWRYFGDPLAVPGVAAPAPEQ